MGEDSCEMKVGLSKHFVIDNGIEKERRVVNNHYRRQKTGVYEDDKLSWRLEKMRVVICTISQEDKDYTVSEV